MCLLSPPLACNPSHLPPSSPPCNPLDLSPSSGLRVACNPLHVSPCVYICLPALGNPLISFTFVSLCLHLSPALGCCVRLCAIRWLLCPPLRNPLHLSQRWGAVSASAFQSLTLHLSPSSDCCVRLCLAILHMCPRMPLHLSPSSRLLYPPLPCNPLFFTQLWAASWKNTNCLGSTVVYLPQGRLQQHYLALLPAKICHREGYRTTIGHALPAYRPMRQLLPYLGSQKQVHQVDQTWLPRCKVALLGAVPCVCCPPAEKRENGYNPL